MAELKNYPELKRASLDEPIVVRVLDVSRVNMTFEVYVVTSENDKGGWFAHPDLGWTQDFDEAEWFMRGVLKWDGCIDLDIGQGGSYQIHFCGLRDALTTAKAFEKLYEVGAELIEGWDADLWPNES